MPRTNKKKCSQKPPGKHPTSLASSLSPKPLSKSHFSPNGSQGTSTLMIQRAVASARKHNINLFQRTTNSSDWNCAFESVLFNVNDRQCFTESIPFSPDYYHRIWLTDFKNKQLMTKLWAFPFLRNGKKVGVEWWIQVFMKGVCLLISCCLVLPVDPKR